VVWKDFSKISKKIFSILFLLMNVQNKIIQVYQRRYEKPPLAARCCHVANDLTNFTGDRQTNEQTNRKTSSSHRACSFGKFVMYLKSVVSGSICWQFSVNRVCPVNSFTLYFWHRLHIDYVMPCQLGVVFSVVSKLDRLTFFEKNLQVWFIMWTNTTRNS